MTLNNTEKRLLHLLTVPLNELTPSKYYEQTGDGMKELPCLKNGGMGVVTFDEQGHRIAYAKGLGFKRNYLVADTGMGIFLAVENRWGQGNYYRVDAAQKNKSVIRTTIGTGEYERQAPSYA